MNLSLSNKNALVGGSTQGIGRAAAIELALLGANVTLLARNAQRLEAVMGELDSSQGQQHHFLVADFADAEEVRRVVSDDMAQRDIVFHILVNNTGGPPAGLISEAAPIHFLQAWQSHLLVNQLLAQTLLEGMRGAQYGRIINIISTSVKEPLSNLGVSNTTRWAVAGWAKTWANEVGQWGITVNNILPGFTATSRLAAIIGNNAAKQETTESVVQEEMLRQVPARRFAQPEEVAAAVAFLASPAASYINGVNLPIDGGRTKSL